MTITVANTEITNTFDYWRVRTNELANAMTVNAVTVGGDPAEGDAEITGIFTANSLSIANNINLANSSSGVNIIIPTTTQAANGQYYLNANGAWAIASVYNNTITTNDPIAQEMDNYPISGYNAAEYLVHIKNLDANGYTITKLLTYHDTGFGYVTEYGIMNSNSSGGVATLGVFSANANSTHVRVYITPQPTATLVKYTRIVV
jgi:hypothetical protein